MQEESAGDSGRLPTGARDASVYELASGCFLELSQFPPFSPQMMLIGSVIFW